MIGWAAREGEWWKVRVHLGRDDVLRFFVVLAHGATERWNTVREV